MGEVTTLAPAKPQPAILAGSTVAAIVPTDLDQVWRLATMMNVAKMAPKDFETPEKISVAILHGLEIGLKPMQAMQRIAVINGRPAVWGDAVIGLVRASGLAEYIDEEIVGEGDQMVAVCKTKRKGEKKEIERTFSVADAKRAGLWDTREMVRRRNKANEWYEAKNDSPWFKYPKRMLQVRARAIALRDGYADVLGGMHIAEELMEAEDQGVDQASPAKDVTPAKPKAELPPAIEQQRTSASSDEIVVEAEVVETATTAEPARASTGKTPLPPLAKTATKPAESENPAPAQQDAAASDFPGDTPLKPSNDDGLDIPPALKRDKDNKPAAAKAAKPKGDVVDEGEWLESIENALTGVEGTAQLAEVQSKYQAPMKGKVSKMTWAKSQTLIMDKFNALTAADNDADEPEAQD